MSPRERIARAVDAAIEAETDDRETAQRYRAFVHERLVEGEDYDALLHRPWRAVVQAICLDLGLRPDWTAWDSKKGFKARAGPPPAEPPASGAPPPTVIPRAVDPGLDPGGTETRDPVPLLPERPG